jgi:hypothetical protein
MEQSDRLQRASLSQQPKEKERAKAKKQPTKQ